MCIWIWPLNIPHKHKNQSKSTKKKKTPKILEVGTSIRLPLIPGQEIMYFRKYFSYNLILLFGHHESKSLYN